MGRLQESEAVKALRLEITRRRFLQLMAGGGAMLAARCAPPATPEATSTTAPSAPGQTSTPAPAEPTATVPSAAASAPVPSSLRI